MALVDPRTSREGATNAVIATKRTGPARLDFVVCRCGHLFNADLNAAKNIGDWAVVMRPMVSDLHPLWRVPVQGQAALL